MPFVNIEYYLLSTKIIVYTPHVFGVITNKKLLDFPEYSRGTYL